jgi:hypothetical protein
MLFDPRYLEVAVREGGSTGSFTTLESARGAHRRLIVVR